MRVAEKVDHVRRMLSKLGIRAAVCVRHRREVVVLMTPPTFKRHQLQVERWFIVIEHNQQYYVLSERDNSRAEIA